MAFGLKGKSASALAAKVQRTEEAFAAKREAHRAEIAARQSHVANRQAELEEEASVLAGLSNQVK